MQGLAYEKLTNVIHHVNKLKENTEWSSQWMQKTLEKKFNMHQWYLKGKKRLKIGIERNFLNLMNDIYQRGKKLSLWDGEQKVPILPFTFNTVLAVLANATRQEKYMRYENWQNYHCSQMMYHRKSKRI